MIIQPANLSRPQPFGTAPNGVTQWEGANALPYLPSLAQQTSEPLFYMSAFPLEFQLISDATAATATGVTYEFQTLGRNYHSVQVSTASGTTYSATVLLEGTLDGVNWLTVASFTAAGINQFTGLYKAMRVSITSYTSGTISVYAISQRS